MLQPRQQYGLGSLVKSAVKGVTGAVKGVASGIKDFAKSDLGKAAIMAGIGFGIPGTSFGGLFGRAGFGGNALGLFGKEGIAATLSGIPGAAKAAEFLGGEKTLGKTLGVFAGGSLLGGLLSKAEQGDPNAMQATRDVGALRNYLTSGYENLGYSAEEIPALVEKDVSEYSSIGGYANGGRIGFANGVTPELMKRINAIIKEIESKPEVKEEEKKPSKLQEQIKKDLEKRHMQDIVVMEKKAYGGRIGYAGGGRDETPEEKTMMEKVKNFLSEAAYYAANPSHNYDKYGRSLTEEEKEEAREKIRQEIEAMGKKDGGRIGYMAGTPEGNAIQASGVMGLPLNQNKAGVTELDLRNSGGFIPPVGVKEKADDIPAMLSNNEFVFTADAVRGMGNGDVNKGAQRMYDMMKKLEKGGRV
jgi:hypothetical protein